MKLNEICEVYSGYALKAFNDAEDGLPVVKIGNILTDGTLNLEECQYTTDSVNEKYYSQRGDIYIALSGATTGKIGIMDTREKYVINQRVGIVRQKSDDVPQEYIKYFLLRQTDRILQEAAGCAQPNISPKQIAEYVIPDTSQEKMQEICEVLDRIKKIIDSRKAEISALDNLIKARFVEMFGDPKINPYDYPVHNLSEYIEFLTSGSRGWAKYCADEGSEWFITIKNVKDCRISTDNMQSVDAPDNAEATRTRVQEGDLLISITADLGRTGVVTKEIADHGAYINQHLTCIRLNQEELEPLYVAYFMESSAGKEQFAAKNQSAVKAGLNFKSINTLRLLVPPRKVQEDFLNFVAQTDKSKVVGHKIPE